jgi:hypothetical protein
MEWSGAIGVCGGGGGLFNSRSTFCHLFVSRVLICARQSVKLKLQRRMIELFLSFVSFDRRCKFVMYCLSFGTTIGGVWIV